MHSIWNSMFDMTNSILNKSDNLVDKNDNSFKNKNSLLVINNMLKNLAIKSIDYQLRIVKALKINMVSPEYLQLISWEDFIRL